MSSMIQNLMRSLQPQQAQQPAQQPAQPKETNPQMQLIEKQQQPGVNPAAHSANPEEEAAKMWQQKPLENPAAGPVFQPDMQKFQEAVGKMDFMKGLDPALVQKALSGDNAAFQEAINLAARQAYAQSTLGSQHLVEAALEKRMKDFETMMAQRFTSLRANERVVEQNPAFKDPSVSPLLNDVQSRLQAQFPEASPAEIAERAQKVLVAMAQKIVGGTPESREAATKKSQDTAAGAFNWAEWATMPTAEEKEQFFPQESKPASPQMVPFDPFLR